MAEAVSPRDLVTALLSGEAAAAEGIPERAAPALPGLAAPPSTGNGEVDDAVRRR
jgi:hypothetical protein